MKARLRLLWAYARLVEGLPIPIDHESHGHVELLCCSAVACLTCDAKRIAPDGPGHVHVTQLPYIRWSPFCAAQPHPAVARG